MVMAKSTFCHYRKPDALIRSGFLLIGARKMAYPPMIKKSHRGLLHEKLGAPQDEKIPAKKLQEAKHSKSPAERKEATFAENFGHKEGGGRGRVPTGGHHQANHREPRSHDEFEKLGGGKS